MFYLVLNIIVYYVLCLYLDFFGDFFKICGFDNEFLIKKY